MKKEMLQHILDYLNCHVGVPISVMEKIDSESTADEQLDDLIGLLYLPENGGIEMISGILTLESVPLILKDL